MKEYESTITFRFKAYNWKLAQKANVHLLNILQKVLIGIVVEVECKSLKELNGDYDD